MRVAHIVIALSTLGFCMRLVESANILAIFSYTFSTPYLVVIPYVQALVDNGHNLTIISPVENLPDIKDVRHIRVPALDILIYGIMNWVDPEYLTNKWKEASLSALFHYNISRAILNDAGVRSLILDKNESFEMVLMEPVGSDALFGIAEHFGASLVGISAFGFSWMIDYMAGNSAPSSYRPISPMGYSQGSSLIDKWNNWIYIAEEWLTVQLIFLPSQLKLFTEYFPYPASMLYHRRRSFSLMIINHHFSLGRVRSNVPNVIEVAGIHLEAPSQPLDSELQSFMDNAENGVIYFSLGLEILNILLPKNLHKILLETFSKLEQRIIWKHEMGTFANKSKNIYVSPIVPQRKILEHHNLKLFITHGGLLSIIEAVNAGIPILGLPMYFDQFDNMKRMKQAGLAQTLDINTMTVKQLTDGITDLLQNPCYTLRAQELSKRFRDQPIKPLEKAVWWTEYVLRHQGADHMRLCDQDVPIASYYNLDFISLLFVRIGLTFVILLIFGFVLLTFLYSELQRSFGHH